jgi:hypothetical protein
MRGASISNRLMPGAMNSACAILNMWLQFQLQVYCFSALKVVL